ncbi:MAG: hypothetical protein P4N59_32205 [Negativicutes bacterium]|nr:hypothetical protein [Negativicutes bacterium]
MSGAGQTCKENQMYLLAVVVGTLGVAYPAYIVLGELYISGKLMLPMPILLLPLVLIVGYFIARGGDMTWVRTWGCLAATSLLCAAPLLPAWVSIIYPSPPKSLIDLTLLIALLGAALFGMGLFFLLLAFWQYKRARRRRIEV